MKTTITQNQIFRTLSRLQRSCCSAVFLLLFLLSASSSWGQVSNPQAFTNLYNGTSNSQNLTYAVPAGTGSNRLLVVAVTTTLQSAANNRTIALTYGGRSLTLAKGDLSSNTQQHTAIYYLNEAGLDLASGTTLAFTATNGTTRVNMVWAAVYDYVDQTTPINTSQNYNSGTSTTSSFSFGTALSLAPGNQGVVVICSHRTGNTNTRNITYPTNWTLENVQTYTTTDAIRSGVAERTIPTTTTTDNCATTFSNSTLASMTGIAINGCTQPTAITGSALSSICQGGTSAGLGGSTGGSATGGSWSDGAVGGTFSPNATTLNATYTPPSTYNGTVTLTLTTSGGSCGTSSASKNLTVTAPNAATISYAGTPFCKSLTTAQAVTRTGTTGGTYTASPAGLTINASTGAITPSSSTAGTYTVTYTMAATGCNAATATTSVTITAVPSAGTLSGTLSICPNGSTTLASTVSGGAWSSSSDAIATINSSTGLVSGVSAGSATMTYTVTGTGGCSDVTTTSTVTVNPLPTAISISPASATICNGDIQSLVASGGVVTSSSVKTLGASGSTTTASTTLLTLGPNPFQSYYGGAKQQMLFRASELTALGISNGDVISSISFNMGSVESRTLQNYVVKMKNTTTTAFASTTFETGLTTVKTAGNVSPVAGWNTLNLTSNFTYTGGNLIIEINFSNNDAGGTGTSLALFDSTSFASTLFYRVDSNTAATVDAATTASFAAYSQRNSIKFSVTNSAQATITWSPTTALFTDAAATTAYTGTGASALYTKPSETTTYTATATSIAGCTSSNTVEITVNPLPTATISAGSAPTTFCAGGSVVLSANTGSGLSYQWKLNGTNITGATASSYTAEASGSYTVTVTNSNNCSATSDATTVTVNTLPNQATATSTNSCGTATLVADGGSASVTWYSDALGTTPVVSSGNITVSSTATTSTLTIVDPTVSTTYYAYTFANGCRSQNNREAAVELKYTNTYTGTGSDWFTAANWSCGIPNANSNVVIPTGKTVSIAYRPNQIIAAAYTVTLQGNASLTVTEDHNLTVTNKATVASGATFTVENDASLVQTDNVTNEGSITVQKSTPSNRLLKRFDAVLWSSPVVQNLQAISTGTPNAYFMQHDPQANSWSAVSSPATADFIKGKGFLVRTPTSFPTTATQQWNVTFTGVPNNGDVTISAGNTGATEKYLLVGNPYPSAISIAAFKAGNPNITGVFYFYRKPNGVTGISSYGTLAANGQFSTNDADNLVGAIAPGDVIASGQGFFVAMKSDNNNGEVYFTNTMRVANDHGHFNRINTNLDSYKLIVQTPLGGNSQFITNYNAETTSGYDVGYDAVAFTDGTTDLSAIMNNEKYRIQSRGDYNSADVIPVQFKTGVAGEHRIKLQDAQGVFAANQMVIIKDNLTGVQHNLTANGDYVFTATAGTFTNRFEVIYQQAYYTALQANSCGSTIANMNSLVYADIVNGATGYRFKVVNNTTSAVQTIDRPQHWFAFNMLSAYDYNTPYTISVQVQKDGVWTGYYGATCTVNSPNIAAAGVMQINPSQCGMTLPTLGTVIATTPVAGATGYKFRITNTTAGAIGNNLVQEITRTNHWFSLGMLSRYNYGSSYAIEVAVKTTGGYTPYGNACTVYSPAVPTLATCGQTVATATTLVRTTAMNLATQYRFQVTRMSTQETITFDTANYWFSFRVNVPGYAAGEQYGVRVAVMTAGAWSPYGDACDITAPIATARTTEEAAPSEAGLFKPVAYPNPFANTFGISLATPSADVVHVMVYDLQGRLIEKQNVFVSQLDSLQIGTYYPSGDYLLVVAQGANIKSSHIHKD